MSCFCLFVCIGVQHILCCVFALLCLSSSCVPYVSSFSGMSVSGCPLGVLFVYMIVIYMRISNFYSRSVISV